MFGAAAIYGATTKRNLNSLGGFLFMGMIGLFVASIVNIFLGSSPFGWAIALIGVVIFTVLTAYDVQRISYGDYAAIARLDREGVGPRARSTCTSTSSTSSCSCFA